MILVKLYNLRLLAVEQCAFNFMCALSCRDFDVDGGGEVARLICLNLLNLQVTLFSDAVYAMLPVMLYGAGIYGLPTRQ